MYFRFLFQASFIFLWLICSLNNNYARQHEEGQYPRSHFVKVSSLLPSTVCNRNSTKVPNKVSLEVVSKYGPCSALNQGKTKTPSYSEILRKDRSRINFIKSRISQSKNLKQTLAISVPAKSETGEYYAVVSLGAPPQDVSLVLDTGSGITWTQCNPCTTHCFEQKDPLFNPARSKSTYSNVPCGSSTCKQLASAGEGAGCISNQCAYQAEYGDGTYTNGLWSTDKLTLTNVISTLVINGYNFGCGINNSAAAGDAEGLEGVSGIMGLDRSSFSFIAQMPASFNKYFSYCLSSSGSSPGYITFGKTAEDTKNKQLSFTLLTNVPQNPEFYGIVITGISVNGKNLSVKDSAYTESSAIIGNNVYNLANEVVLSSDFSFQQKDV